MSSQRSVRHLVPEGRVVSLHDSGWTHLPALWPEERDLVARAAPKRHLEFRAGRTCARIALAELGHRPAALSRDADGVPVWPPDVVGSISHSQSLGVAVVARRSTLVSVGIDIEPLRPFPKDALPLTCTARERAMLPALGRALHLDPATLVFSAKESFYKCYFPVARTFLDFHDVDLTIGDGVFEVRINRPDAPAQSITSQGTGRFTVAQGHLWTSFSLPQPVREWPGQRLRDARART